MPEIILVLFVLVGAALLLRRLVHIDKRRGRAHFARRWIAPLMAVAILVAMARAAVWYSNAHESHTQATLLKREVPAESREHGYVSSAGCRSCHPGHFESWHATYHRTMTQAATAEAVVGDFNNHRVSYDGVEYLFFRRAGGFWARMTPPGSPPQEVQLVMTTGSHHYQVYWTGEGPDRWLKEFPLAWLISDRRWIPREAALIMPPHLKQKAVIWNGVCIRCHSTHSQPRIELASQKADTSAVDLGIACEACHGPGEAHVLANQNPLRRYSRHLAAAGDETIVNPSQLSAERSSQACGQCHAIASFSRQDWWRGHWNDFRPGEDLNATRHVIRPNAPQSLVDLQQQLKQEPDFLRSYYWSDGMVRVSGREYNGLIESPCYQGGKFSCLSCHSMHDSDPNDQLAAGMQSDQACLQCHEKYREKLAEHTHHAPSSAGSRCYNCHMPHTTYGLLKAIRSHQISSPSVASSVQTGRPNACNQCHLDKTLGWTQAHLGEWYGTPIVELDEQQSTLSAMAVMLLRGDAGQRALAAWSMGWEEAHAASGQKWQAPYLAQLFKDPYPAVRYIAARTLKRLPGFEEFPVDFVGSADHRSQAHANALAAWEQARGGRLDQTGESILIDSDGRLDRAALERLLKQRDDRDIDLKE